MTAPRVLAHRGANRVAPENTLEAFVAAGALGADGVELDVHRTADRALVVHHDADARGLGVLAERPEAEIRAARPEIPTLEEALDACTGMLVNTEVKNMPGDADYDPEDGVAAAVVELLVLRDRRDDVLVSSFNLESADRVRALDRSIPTGFLTLVRWVDREARAALPPPWRWRSRAGRGARLSPLHSAEPDRSRVGPRRARGPVRAAGTRSAASQARRLRRRRPWSARPSPEG